MKISPLTLLKTYAPVLCFIVLTTLVARSRGIDDYKLVTDPLEFADQPPYVGLFSQVGNFFWCAAAVVCLFSAFIIQASRTAKRSSNVFLFLLCSGLLCTQLLLDDLFLLHENFPKVLYGSNAEISRAAQDFAESIVFAIYGLVFIVYVVTFRKVILRSRSLFLILAVGFLGISAIVDLTPDSWQHHYIVEESFKLLGIFSWFLYFSRFCAQTIQQQFEQKFSRELQVAIPQTPNSDIDADIQLKLKEYEA